MEATDGSSGQETEHGVANCPERGCVGTALLTYAAIDAEAPPTSIRIITAIACNRDGCRWYAPSTEVATTAGGLDPR